MLAEIFQRQENEVKECGLKTVNKVKASNFLAGGPEFLATPLHLGVNIAKKKKKSQHCRITDS